MGYAEELIKYAHKIEKNTAEFTVNDLATFTKGWVQQMTPAQRAEFNKDVKAMAAWRANAKVEAPVEEAEVEAEVVVEIGFTQADVNALYWALSTIFETYELEGSVHDEPLKGLVNGLKDLAEK